MKAFDTIITETTDSIIGDAILDDLARLVQPQGHAAVETAPIAEMPPAVEARIGWQLHIEFDGEILRNGSNPLDLLDDLGKLGACFAVALTEDVPFLDELDPERCFLKWDVTLHSDCSRDAIDDVFIFVQDEMKLVCTPLAAAVASPGTRGNQPAPGHTTAATPASFRTQLHSRDRMNRPVRGTNASARTNQPRQERRLRRGG